jgi:serine/threonine protein kinase
LYFSGPAADWWSTGVMLFEMLTGIPPFNAEHPQVIFDNILNRNIPWPHVPEDMSHEAQDLINKLLTEDPNERLGANGAMEVKAHPFFKNINWDTLARQKVRVNTSSLDHIYLYFQPHISLHNVSLYLSVIFCLMNV